MKIGEFAKLSSATIRTLRYYDDLGLLKPDSIDKFTGYRIYSSEKLEQMREIQAMKEIGFTLLEIKSFLEIDSSDEAKKIEFVSLKRKEIEIESQKIETRLSALDKLIVKLKDGGDKMEKRNYYLPFCDDEGLIERRRIHNEENSRAYSDMKTSPKFIKVCANYTGFGAVAEDGTPYIWGGQRNIIEGLPPVAELAVGRTHIAAVDIYGKLHGWGAETTPEIDFQDNLPKMVSVKACSNKTVALSEDGKVFCWGQHNKSAQQDVPRNMGFVKQIAACPYNSAALNSDGKVITWGVFDKIPPRCDSKITEVAMTDYNIACLGEDGKVYGDFDHKELNKRFKPKPEMTNIKKIFAGCDCFAAIDGDGILYVWGECNQLPDSNSVLNVPLNLPPVADVAFGAQEIMCLGEDGKLYGWGILDVVVPPVFDGFENGPVFEYDETVDINAPADVYTFEELCDAVREKIRSITIKADITVRGDSLYITNDITLTIAKGVTLTVSSPNFFVQGKLINNGTLKTQSDDQPGKFTVGRISVLNPIEGTGNVIVGKSTDIFGNSIDWGVAIIGVNPDELNEYLSEDSIYTSVSYPNTEETEITISKDLIIPKGRGIWLNERCTLKVNEGVTLIIEGKITVYKEPIINGTVIGEIYNPSFPKENDVYTFEELCETIPQKNYKWHLIPDKVTIKKNMTITENMFVSQSSTVLIVEEGVTLTIDSCYFSILGQIVNNGTIDGRGHAYVHAPIRGTGNVDISGGLRIDLYDAEPEELVQCLAEDSIYTEIIWTNIHGPQARSVFLQNPPESLKSFVTIDRDIVIPKGKSMSLTISCTLKVKEGVTLKVDGRLETFNEPVIEGKVIGDITVIDTNEPKDVYTFEEFYAAARNRINEITVKDNITVPGSIHGTWIPSNTVIVDKGVTLTCDNCIFNVKKKLINNGTIDGTGSVHVHSLIDGTGNIDISDGLEIKVSGITADEIGEYFTENSIYSSIWFFSENSKRTVLTISRNLVIPKDKKLWLNAYCTLEVKDGVILKIDGRLETYNEPLIYGTVIGDITVLPDLVPGKQQPELHPKILRKY